MKFHGKETTYYERRKQIQTSYTSKRKGSTGHTAYYCLGQHDITNNPYLND